MRSVFYGTAVVFVLAVLVAFAIAPSVAKASNQLVQQTATTIEHKDATQNPDNAGFSGAAQAGANQSPIANSLINCQRAMLGKFCALPGWALGNQGATNNRYNSGHE